MTVTALAVDLGSSSGRAITEVLDDDRITETEVHRLPHAAAMRDGYLCWGLDLIRQEMIKGLQLAVERFPGAASASVDTWGVDWVALGAGGELLTPGRCYRDERINRTPAASRERLPDEKAWELIGTAPATINSTNQLFAYLSEEPESAARTEQILFLPDWFTYLLTGVRGWSRSITSTSGLCTLGVNDWVGEVFDALGVPHSWVGELTSEYDIAGPCTIPGPEQLTMARAGVHDPARAVAVLQRDEGATYFLLTGSWSVLGVLQDEPLLGEQARTLGLINEARTDGGVRPLFNITGLWILRGCQRDWKVAGQVHDIAALAGTAHRAGSLGVVIGPDDPRYVQPSSMVERATGALRAGGASTGINQGQLVRTLCGSFAECRARGVRNLAALTGQAPTQLNLVEGGSRNTLLCNLTARSLGVPVLAGPAEAPILGSLLGQFEITGALDPACRNEVITATAETRIHRP